MDAVKRIGWVDIAKGIAILLVITGHGVGDPVRGLIFSFHMPLFFILSGLTFKYSQDANDFLIKTKKAFIHLFLAAAGIYFIKTCVSLYRDIPMLADCSFREIKEYFADIINVFIAGGGVQTKIGDTYIEAIGIPWFLFALFGGRTLFDYLHLTLNKKTFILCVFFCSVAGVCIGRVQSLPFSFDIALAIQPFFLFGQYLKQFDIEKNPIRNFLISMGSWLLIFLLQYLLFELYLEIACRTYTLYPLCFVGAISGTMFISYISLFLSKLKFVSIPFQYLGRKSMTMLWVHCFDGYYKFLYNLTAHDSVNTLIRILIDIIVFALAELLLGFISDIRKHAR